MRQTSLPRRASQAAPRSPVRRVTAVPRSPGAASFVHEARGQTVGYALARRGTALLVELTETSHRDSVALVALFDDAASFETWVDGLALRFDDPRIHLELKRHGRQILLAS